jgi:hypothetical protein
MQCIVRLRLMWWTQAQPAQVDAFSFVVSHVDAGSSDPAVDADLGTATALAS